MRTPLKTFTRRHAQFSDSHLDSIHTHVAQVLSPSPHPHVMVICVFVVVSCSYSFLFFLFELPTELDNPIVMESLRDFAENESEDTLNAFTSPSMRIDALESTTNSLSWGLIVDGALAHARRQEHRGLDLFKGSANSAHLCCQAPSLSARTSPFSRPSFDRNRRSDLEDLLPVFCDLTEPSCKESISRETQPNFLKFHTMAIEPVPVNPSFFDLLLGCWLFSACGKKHTSHHNCSPLLFFALPLQIGVQNDVLLPAQPDCDPCTICSVRY